MPVGWHSGRAIWTVPLAAVAAVVVLYPFLYVVFAGPWAPFEEPRYVQLFEVVPIICGIAGLYGITSRLAWVEGQSPRVMSWRALLAASGVVLGAALLPVFVRRLWGLSPFYLRFLPAGRDWLTPDLLDVELPFEVFLTFGLNIAACLGLACLTTRFVGPLLGPATAMVWFLGLLVAQGYGRLPILVRVDDVLPTASPGDLALTGLIVASGVIVWALPGSQVSPRATQG